MPQTDTAQTLETYLRWLMDGSTAERPLWNQEHLRSGQPNRWNYIDGCMVTAILAMHEATGDGRYLRFADDFVGGFVADDGRIRTYDAAERNLDNINPGRALHPLYRLTGKVKYRLAMEPLHEQLASMPRTAEGNFWHKGIYPHQVWLDGLYMAQPFYMDYETSLNGMRNCPDIFAQFTTVRKRMRDERTGLYYHGYDESRKMFWADPQTGLSRSFWLRALGWFYMALVDCLSLMSEELYYEYRTLQAMLRELTDALLAWQAPDGMFYQVVNAPQEPGNYRETSGTAILAYGLLKATRLGYLPARYRAYGLRAFEGTAARYLRTGENGLPELGGICLVAGLGGENRRDGSHAYYYSEPIVSNEAKGVAPMLMAMTEVIRG